MIDSKDCCRNMSRSKDDFWPRDEVDLSKARNKYPAGEFMSMKDRFGRPLCFETAPLGLSYAMSKAPVFRPCRLQNLEILALPE